MYTTYRKVLTAVHDSLLARKSSPVRFPPFPAPSLLRHKHITLSGMDIHVRACGHVYTHTHTHTHTVTHTCTHTHTHTHTRTHARTHTYTHTRARATRTHTNDTHHPLLMLRIHLIRDTTKEYQNKAVCLKQSRYSMYMYTAARVV